MDSRGETSTLSIVSLTNESFLSGVAGGRGRGGGSAREDEGHKGKGEGIRGESERIA
jgi:hypothetical protein